MRLGSLLHLTSVSLRRDLRSAGFSAFGVAVGVGALVFFIALGSGVGRVVRERVFPVDARLVEVVPPAVTLGGFFGEAKLDGSTVARLKELPGVRHVHRKMNVKVPAVSIYEGSFFGSFLRMGLEILAVGVEPELVAADVRLGKFADLGPRQPIPAMAATRLIEIYNKSFAPARKLPALSETLVMGFTFPVEFNRSFVAQTVPGPVTKTQAQIVGISERGLLAGITIPLDVAIRINRAHGVDAETYTGATLVAADPSAVPGIVEAVRKMGLGIDDKEQRLAENVGMAVVLTTSALALLSILVCVLAAINIAHALSASIRARAKEIGIMRAVGATRPDVQNLVLTEAATVGLFGGVLGTLAAWGASLAVDAVSGAYLPPFPFKPESYFVFTPLLLLGGPGLGLLAALSGAYMPSRRAARMDPARTLAG